MPCYVVSIISIQLVNSLKSANHRSIPLREHVLTTKSEDKDLHVNLEVGAPCFLRIV